MSEKFAPNPYVGPRSFRETDAPFFFGRERELSDLMRMMISERIVLLYSPSGAGKTSLLRAGVVPALQKEGFHVYPIVRVNRELPDRERDRRGNRFIASTLLSLQEELDVAGGGSSTPVDTVDWSLAAHLDTRRSRAADDAPKYEVLIFDQFEEILTTEPASRAVRGERFAFFEAVAEALYDQNRWAVFSIREDYLAGLDPYRRPLPTQLSNHFRLDLLNLAGARRAISEPPRVAAGVTIDDAAVARIVDNLSRSAPAASSPDSASAGEVRSDGIYVEPLHLQVVCDRLWETLRPVPGSRVTEGQIGDLVEVDAALRGYYDDEVRRIARESPYADEREIRDWFEEKLIVNELGIRGQVPHEEGRSGGLDNRAVAELVAAKLVNKETRLKNAWYELSHDRLVKQIRESNAGWYRDNLEDFQRAARIWANRNEPPSGLLGLPALVRARSRVRRRKIRLRKYERSFLNQSRAALWQRYSVFVLLVSVVLAIVIARLWPSEESASAILARDANAWARSAHDLLPDDQAEDLDLGLLMSAEAVGQLHQLEQAGEDVRIGYVETNSLFDGVVAQPHLVGPVRNSQARRSDAPDTGLPQALPGSLRLPVIALGSGSLHVASWDPAAPGMVSLTNVPLISLDNEAGADSRSSVLSFLQVSTSSTDDEEESVPPTDTVVSTGGTVSALAFLPSSGGDILLAVGTESGTVEVWGQSPGNQGERWYTLDPGGDEGACAAGAGCAGVTRLATTFDGMLLAGYADGSVIAWTLPSPADAEAVFNRIACPELPSDHQTPCGKVTGLAVGDGGRLAISYSEGVLGLVEDPGSDLRARRLDGLPQQADIRSVAVANGEVFVVLRAEGRFQVGSMGLGGIYREFRDQPLPTSGVTDVVMSTGDAPVVFWGQRDGQILKWAMKDAPETLSPATGFAVHDLEASVYGTWLVSRSGDGLVQAWSTSGVSLLGQPVSQPEAPHSSCVVDVTFRGSSLSSQGAAGATAEQDIRQLPATPIPVGVVSPQSSPGGTPSSPNPFALPRAAATPIAPVGTPAGYEQPGTRGTTTDVRCVDMHRLAPEDLAELPATQDSDDLAGTPGPAVSPRDYGVADLDNRVRAVVHENGDVVLFRPAAEGWQRLTGRLPEAGSMEIVSTALSGDGTGDGALVAFGHRDGSISLWMNDDGNWRPLGRLAGHLAPVTALRFDEAKHYLASGDESGLVVAWNLEPTEWIQFACYRAGRAFTDEEISVYLERDPDEWREKLICGG